MIKIWKEKGNDSRGGEKRGELFKGREKERGIIQEEEKGEGKDSMGGERTVDRFNGGERRGERCKGRENTWGNSG